MTRQRQPTAAEVELWRRAMAEAEPLAEKPRAAGPAPAAKATAAAPPVARAPKANHAPTALDPQRPIGIDRRSWLRLKRGQVVIEKTVDLHGMTQEQAHERLTQFLADAQRGGLRCVLVVTGKGLLHGGVLRHTVPRWLNEGANRERVLAFAPAQPKHGGAGALYLLIRRARRTR
jgi:DNA-nicking Smr family endonuclease